MAKLLNFTLEGHALRVTAFLTPAGETAYTVELQRQYDKEALTHKEFIQLRKALYEDSRWGGVLDCGHLSEFEETWKGEEGCDRQQGQEN